ncbi:uncharacterized protein LOC116179201 isoform X1 [Photinus pyralis]|nr:uncharacterized protein LOC116179201 isoform X1 [Photinus pyralis]
MSWEMKNRCGRSELTSQLYRIERERRDDVRMHDTMAQQFKARRSVLNFYLDKTGKGRLEAQSSVCYEDIHDMLFTDGELDVDKILCLHLLTAHRAETLTPPARSRRPISFLSKDQSPLEKLIERSRKRRVTNRCPKLSPTYVLDVNNEQKEVITDGRLAERTIINDKIMLLIQTVLEALQVSNPEKMKDLQTKAQDGDVLMGIAQKPEMQDFLQILRKQLIVSSCECFHLTQPFKAATVPLQVAPSALSLKSLVNYIRGNVLQNPSQSTWGDMYDREVGSKEEMISSYFYEKSYNSIDGFSSRSRPEARAEETEASDIGNLTRRTLDLDDPKTSRATVLSADDTSSGPKRRKLPVTSLEQVDDDNIAKIGVDRLAVIVDLHMRKLNSEEKRPSNIQKSPSLRVYKSMARGRVGSKASNDSVELNVYDLAKISQEIRQKETQQKFERFLKDAH